MDRNKKRSHNLWGRMDLETGGYVGRLSASVRRWISERLKAGHGRGEIQAYTTTKNKRPAGGKDAMSSL